jgi:hypothetical protein
MTNIGPRYLLTAAVRNATEVGRRIEIAPGTLGKLLEELSIPADPLESIDLLLQVVLRKAGKSGKTVSFNSDVDYPLIVAQDQDEFWYIVNKALELNLVEHGPNRSGHRLSIPGWKRLSELRSSAVKSTQAFIAMWFDPSLNEAWAKGFKLACEHCGYTQAIRIDLQEHNEKICDRIIAEIKKSGLVICDFTGQRGGVYFEAGFALGLQKPVIWTCREDNIKELHFDTRQYNHIVWTTAEDLRHKLINRIEATVQRET